MFEYLKLYCKEILLIKDLIALIKVNIKMNLIENREWKKIRNKMQMLIILLSVI